MAWKGDLKIYTVTVSIQCNTICPHTPPPYILPTQILTLLQPKQINFLFYMHFFFPLKILAKCKKNYIIRKWILIDTMERNIFLSELEYFSLFPYYNVAQNSLKYWYSQFINSMQNKNVLSELKQNQTDRKIVHIIIINFSSILLA